MARAARCASTRHQSQTGGAIIAGVVIAEDMQERLAAEEERVRLRADEAAARKAAELKQLLMANVSHEMRTPLNVIIEQIQCITDMRDSGQLLLTLVDDILTFSHLEAGKLTLSSAPFQLQRLLTQAVNVLAAAARAKQLTVTTRIDPDLSKVMIGDEIRLRQVRVNLMSNAVKFTRKGGEISVHIEYSAPPTVASSAQQPAAPSEPAGSHTQLPVSADAQYPPSSACGTFPEASASSHEAVDSGHVDRPPEMRIRFNVEDTGVGISKEALPRLFKPFSQADASTTRKYGGTGLGLSICKRLVEAMGGEIGVAGRTEGGAHFWFEVPMCAVLVSRLDGASPLEHAGMPAGTRPSPLAREHAVHACTLQYSAEVEVTPLGEVLQAATSTPREVTRSAPPLAGVRLLVAEDNVVNQRVVERILTRLGAAVTIVEDGAAAVQAVTKAQPIFDAVLMDCAMPLCDGYEATKLIRELPESERCNIPIIALTAGALQQDIQRSLEAGMNAHVAKPLDPGSLVATIRRFVRASDV